MIAKPVVSIDDASEFGTRTATYWQWLIWWSSDWRPLPQSWRRYLRKHFARGIQGPFDIIHEGLKLRLYPAENYCDRVLFGRRDLPEREEHLSLTQHAFPGMVFVDIGANVGSYSCFVGSLAQGDITLLALEPHPRTFQKLCYNLSANKLPLENVKNCGVGSKKAEMDLWSDGGSNIGHTSMLKEGTSNPKLSVRVPVLPLSELLFDAGIDRIDLLKIDIEGFEDRALAPFLDSAARTLLPKVILIEVAHDHLWERDLHRLLMDLGYEPILRTAENRLLKLRD